MMIDTASPRSSAADPFGDVVATLAEEFGGEVSREVIERCVAGEADRLGSAKIPTFLGVLVYKAARDKLRFRRRSQEVPSA